ncbi:MAG: hypothetical protein ACERKN_07295 [Velocimicrobium sp.]
MKGKKQKMAPEKEKATRETIEILKQLDIESLILIRSNASVLKARDEMDRKSA